MQAPPKVIAKSGKRVTGQCESAERGTLVTHIDHFYICSLVPGSIG